MKSEHKFPYLWNLADGYPKKNGLKVFSCFSCGGGSTMGYKLAGFEVIGCNEIDPKMMEVYKANHNPKYSYLEGIQTFKNREDLPEELFNLDILDGSPPCSSFSMAGNREKDWGKEKKFREGQTEQVLDTLFFDFIELAERLQPKVVIAENVKGLLIDSAFEYVKKIYSQFEKAGFYCQHFLLDSSEMGVPQKRERVFFICIRKDLASPFMKQVDMFKTIPVINLLFNEKAIPFKEVRSEIKQPASISDLRLSKIHSGFVKNTIADIPHNTITSRSRYIDEDGNKTTDEEFKLVGSYPQDYNFLTNPPQYLIGMSVPPVMMAQIASRVYDQWLSKIKQNQLTKAA